MNPKTMDRLWMVPSWVAGALVVVGPLASWLGVSSPLVGFFLLVLGFAMAAVSGVAFAGGAALATVFGRPWRRRALRGAVIPLGIALVLFLLLRSQGNVPAMNDVSTDLEDRPALSAEGIAASGVPEHDEETLVRFAEWQRTFYADVQPLVVAEAPDVAFEKALRIARLRMGWEIASSDPEAGRIEAVARTRVFRFVDDVVVRVRPEGEGSRIDLRSRSRLGQGDLGANANRIRGFVTAYREAER